MHRPGPRPFIGAAGAILLGGVLLSSGVFAQSPAASPAASVAPIASLAPCAVPAASPAAVVASPSTSGAPLEASPAASTAPDASAQGCTAPTASTAPIASATPAVAKVSANTATTDELIAALTAAGVARADRWAREIEEYRPYDTADPTLQHLQDELAKYNPDPETLAGILSVLQP